VGNYQWVGLALYLSLLRKEVIKMLWMLIGLLVVGEKEVTGAIKVCLRIPGKKVEREESFYGDDLPPSLEVLRVLREGKDIRVLVAPQDTVRVFAWIEIRRGKERILGQKKEIEIRKNTWIRFRLGRRRLKPGDFVLLRIVGEEFEKNIGFVYRGGWDDALTW